MPIWEEICRAEQKYMPFFGTVTERLFRKKIQSTETYTNWFNAALWIFSGKHARWRSRVLDFSGKIVETFLKVKIMVSKRSCQDGYLCFVIISAKIKISTIRSLWISQVMLIYTLKILILSPEPFIYSKKQKRIYQNFTDGTVLPNFRSVLYGTSMALQELEWPQIKALYHIKQNITIANILAKTSWCPRLNLFSWF